MLLHKNNPAHLEHRPPKSPTHTDTQALIDTFTHMHILPQTQAQKHICTCARIMNSAVYNGWAEESGAILFPLHWLNGQYALYTLFYSFPYLLSHHSHSLSHSTFHGWQYAALHFAIKLVTLHHFISVSTSEAASWSWSVFSVILFVSHLCPIS